MAIALIRTPCLLLNHGQISLLTVLSHSFRLSAQRSDRCTVVILALPLPCVSLHCIQLRQCRVNDVVDLGLADVD